MLLKIDANDVNRFILVGDKVLIKPKTINDKTRGGLYLPPGIQEKQKIQSGYIIKTGPGYPIPAPMDQAEPWKEAQDDQKYFSLQARQGDLAIFLQDNAFEIEFEKEKYFIVSHSSILMLVREEG